MLKGIDISGWQADIDLARVDIGFCIVKATEGTSYVNPNCDKHVQQAVRKRIPWGTYHFARNGNAKSEALFYHQSISGYESKGICVLDYETWQTGSVSWCEEFIAEFQRLSRIWPLLYISASHCKDFEKSWIPSKCGLWVAGYPNAASAWTNAAMQYDVKPWNACAIWQFTSTLRLSGYNANLDGDIAYMDASAWAKYATAAKNSESSKVQPVLNMHDLVLEIWLGEWGNGTDRKRMLKNAGYDYDTVQSLVNKYVAIARECIQGKWGNGWNRQTALESHGYKYSVVQSIVNSMIGKEL